MGVLTIKSVKLKGQQVRIDGTRRTLLYDKKGKLALYGSESPEVEIMVDLHGADPNMVLPQLENDLFFPSLGDAVAAVPNDCRAAFRRTSWLSGGPRNNHLRAIVQLMVQMHALIIDSTDYNSSRSSVL